MSFIFNSDSEEMELSVLSESSMDNYNCENRATPTTPDCCDDVLFSFQNLKISDCVKEENSSISTRNSTTQFIVNVDDKIKLKDSAREQSIVPVEVMETKGHEIINIEKPKSAIEKLRSIEVITVRKQDPLRVLRELDNVTPSEKIWFEKQKRRVEPMENMSHNYIEKKKLERKSPTSKKSEDVSLPEEVKNKLIMKREDSSAFGKFVQMNTPILKENNQKYISQEKYFHEIYMQKGADINEKNNKMASESEDAEVKNAALNKINTKEIVEKITIIQEHVCIQYKEILGLLQTSKLPSDSVNKYMIMLNSLMRNIKCITNSYTSDTELEQAKIMSSKFQKIMLDISNDIMLHKQLITESQALPNKKKIDFLYLGEDYKQYQKLKDYLSHYEEQFNDLLRDPHLSKFKFECQIAVNIPLNTISFRTGIHLRDKYRKLFALLSGDKIKASDSSFKATEHPKGLHYCTALLARKIVQQGVKLVSSNHDAAYPIAAVSVALSSHFPELTELLVANFHKECPYIIPMFPVQCEGQAETSFRESNGFLYGDEIMTKHMFLKRVSGVFRLQCAIWITKSPTNLNTESPATLQCAYRWLTSFINTKRASDVCATVLYDFLDVCGSELLKLYNQSFMEKVLYLSEIYLPTLNDGSPRLKLEELLRNVLKSGRFPSPNVVLPNSW